MDNELLALKTTSPVILIIDELLIDDEVTSFASNAQCGKNMSFDKCEHTL